MKNDTTLLFSATFGYKPGKIPPEMFSDVFVTSSHILSHKLTEMMSKTRNPVMCAYLGLSR